MARYRLYPPGVNVYQIFESANLTIVNPVLTPCLIGQAKQIRTNRENGVYTGEATSVTYPDKLITSVVEKSEVAVSIRAVDGDHELEASAIPVQGTDGTTDSDDETLFIDATKNFVTSGIVANDVLVIMDNGVYTQYKIEAVAATELTIPAGLGEDAAGLDYFIFKAGKFVALDASVLLASGIGFAGTILVSYKAIRTDHKNDFFRISTNSHMSQNFDTEDIVPENPLPYAIQICRANATPGLTIYGVVVEEDTLIEHVSAMNFIGRSPDPWSIVPLTQRTDILQSYKQHVIASSEPLEKKERVLLMSHIMITKDLTKMRKSEADPVLYEESVTGATLAGTDRFQDASIDFTLSSVQAGIDMINILEGPLTGAYPIDVVTNNHEVSLTMPLPSTLTGVKYEIVRNFFDSGEMAENIQARSSAMLNRRVVAVWPHEVFVTDPTLNVEIAVPSYYACAAIAGIAASLPPQTPFSRMSLAGFTGLSFSNDYFTEEELDMMAYGGTWILVQNGEGAAIECRHQLTTDTTTVQRREWNITKVVDFIAKSWRTSLTPLTGRNLLTEGFVRNLNTHAHALVNSAIKSGFLMPGTTLTSIAVNADAPDTVDFNFRIIPPYPANTFNLYLVI